MASMNMASKKKKTELLTFEGGQAVHQSAESELRRAVMANMLWENSFYESGVDIANRISTLVKQVKSETVAQIAIEAREQMHLRHVPLQLCVILAKNKELKSDTLTRVIQRPDELTEFMALYWKEGRCPISNQVKKGLAAAFNKFNEYELAKYNQTGQGKITLRDVMFMVHPRPNSYEQALLFKKLVDGNLATPDTWEVALSSGADKKTTFERLINEKKLGGLALLRNLRNMIDAKVPIDFLRNAVLNMRTDKVLPFRFLAAANFAPALEPELEKALFKSTETLPRFSGETAILIDVSGSMVGTKVSEKSDMDRLDAAAALAMIMRELGSCRIFTFSDQINELPARRGFAIRDLCRQSQHGGTWLGRAVDVLNRTVSYDRLIVITDEQSSDAVGAPKAQGYMINVASYSNSVGYGPWLKITGWSEAIVSYITNYEIFKN